MPQKPLIWRAVLFDGKVPAHLGPNPFAISASLVMLLKLSAKWG